MSEKQTFEKRQNIKECNEEDEKKNLMKEINTEFLQKKKNVMKSYIHL